MKIWFGNLGIFKKSILNFNLDEIVKLCDKEQGDKFYHQDAILILKNVFLHALKKGEFDIIQKREKALKGFEIELDEVDDAGEKAGKAKLVVALRGSECYENNQILQSKLEKMILNIDFFKRDFFKRVGTLLSRIALAENTGLEIAAETSDLKIKEAVKRTAETLNIVKGFIVSNIFDSFEKADMSLKKKLLENILFSVPFLKNQVILEEGSFEIMGYENEFKDLPQKMKDWFFENLSKCFTSEEIGDKLIKKDKQYRSSFMLAILSSQDFESARALTEIAKPDFRISVMFFDALSSVAKRSDSKEVENHASFLFNRFSPQEKEKFIERGLPHFSEHNPDFYEILKKSCFLPGNSVGNPASTKLNFENLINCFK